MALMYKQKLNDSFHTKLNWKYIYSIEFVSNESSNVHVCKSSEHLSQSLENASLVLLWKVTQYKKNEKNAATIR